MKTLLSIWCRATGWLVSATSHTISLALPLLAGTVAFEVFSRYVLDRPTLWAYDVSLFLFGYIGALCGAHAQLKKSHINVDIVYLAVSQRWKNAFDLLANALGGFFLLVIATKGWEKAVEAMEFGYTRQSEWAPSISHFWIMVTAAAVLFLLQLSADMIKDTWHLITGEPLLSEEEQQ
ncbi:TRAP transporter small permease [Oceanimonas sp. CHS3-5]|uniref:TRAP transporter small permease subunit n=1 Tax=Oceanimonas sp. CHS3-5 TaxID=3068186 RepID=UPI00273D6128|nr:TRAP transporter small permease [Oceanimonas sp. CHS3-5]MDP5292420.1 TRAP transporter small permease [Oceanimonas sp. CHS3-5]